MKLRVFFIILLICVLLVGCGGEKTSTTITLSPNMGTIENAIVKLTNNDRKQKHVYQQKSKGTAVGFNKIVPGSYTLTITHDDYFPYTNDNVTVHNTVAGLTANLIKNEISINLNPNFGDIIGAVITLTNNNGNKNHIYTLKNTDKTVKFQRVEPGTYKLTVQHDNYFDLTRETVLNSKNTYLYVNLKMKSQAGGMYFMIKVITIMVGGF